MASVMCQDPKQTKVTDPSLFLGTLTPPLGAGSCCGPGLLFSMWATWPGIPESPGMAAYSSSTSAQPSG